MAVTMQQIADLAGVSRGTVDRALNGRGRINPEVAKRVQQIADDLGYQPKHRKKTEELASKKSYCIGVVTQLAGSSFMIKVNEGIEAAKEELAERGIRLRVKASQSVDENEQARLIQELQQEGIDALALMPVESDLIRENINQLMEEDGIPVVTFNSDIVGTKRNCYVGLDNRKSGHTAAGLMGLLVGGKGKILIITGFFSNSVSSRRVDGFIETMNADFPQIELVGVQCSFDRGEEVERIIVNTMRVFPELDGIFLASGGQAGVGKAFEALHIEKRPYVIIYDHTPKNEKALREGIVDFLIDQEGREQGYRAITLLGEMLLKGTAIEQEYQYTEISIRNKYNV